MSLLRDAYAGFCKAASHRCASTSRSRLCGIDTRTLTGLSVLVGLDIVQLAIEHASNFLRLQPPTPSTAVCQT